MSTAHPPCLFLPGAGADPAFWRPLGDRLPGAWPKTYFGWPGLGHQPRDPAVTSIPDLVAMVERDLGDGPADLLAQSMGGLIALTVALRHPTQVRRIVLSVTSGGVDVQALGGIDWRANYRREYPEAAAWIGEVHANLTAELPRIAQPVLLIWGEDDAISPPAVGQRLAELLPNARLLVVPGAGHDVVETHATALAALVEAHLA